MNLRITLLTIGFFCAAFTASAFNLDSFSKATEAVTGGDTSDPLALCTQLLTSFSGNAEATNYAKGLLNSFKAEDYLGAFGYYDKIKSAKLTDAQMKTWNDVKNPLSAIILERNFSYQDSGLADLVTKATASLQGNDTEGASNYLTQLKQAATLSAEQKAIVGDIMANLPLLK